MKNKHTGVPFRLIPLVVIIVVWNGLFLCDYLLYPKYYNIKYLCMFIAIVLLFIGSIAIRMSELFQKIVLKPDRKIAEIKYALNSAAIASGIIMIVLFAMIFRAS